MWKKIRTRVLVIALAALALQMTSGAMPAYSPWSAPVSLGAVVNSPYDDALAALSKDELSLYFTSNRPVSEGGIGNYDIWVTQRATVDAPWGAPVCLQGPVNTVAFDAGPALSRDGHLLFFHRMTERGDLDLMVSMRDDTHDDFGWGEPWNLGPNVNSEFNDAGAAFFEGDDGAPAELYFGSTRFGNFDIFVSRLGADGTFGPAQLVPELSSPANDQRPAISHDGREIYITSGRPGGIGNSDVWVSTRASVFDPWTVPVNVAEINTTDIDAQATLSSDGEVLIFNSNRPGVLGGTDLFMSTRHKAKGRH